MQKIVIETVSRLDRFHNIENERNEKLEAVNREKEEQMRKINEISSENRRLTKKNLEYKNTSKKQANGLSSAKHRITELTKENAVLKKQIRDDGRLNSQKLEKLQAINEDLKRENEVLNEKINDAQNSLKKSHDSYKEQEKVCEKLNEKVQRLIEQIKASDRKMDDESKRLKTLQSTLTDVNEKNRHLKKDLSLTQNNLTLLEAETKTLSQKLAKCDAENSCLHEELYHCDKTATEAHEKQTQLENKLKELTADNDILQMQIEERKTKAMEDAANLLELKRTTTYHCRENRRLLTLQYQLENAVDNLKEQNEVISERSLELCRRIEILVEKREASSQVLVEVRDILNERVKVSWIWNEFYISQYDQSAIQEKLKKILHWLTSSS